MNEKEIEELQRRIKGAKFHAALLASYIDAFEHHVNALLEYTVTINTLLGKVGEKGEKMVHLAREQ